MVDEIALILPTPAEPPNGEYKGYDRGGLGKQLRARYPNGYGASVVQGPFSYGGESGLYELAVFHNNKVDEEGQTLCYASPITSDVVGWLTAEEVVAKLHEIAQLPPVENCSHERASYFVDDEDG
jgi:hypothetical protein